MKKNWLLVSAVLVLGTNLLSRNSIDFKFTHEPIDVVFPCAAKDAGRTLDLAIEGARKNIKNIGRIIVVSDKRYTQKAEWFDEKLFPFSKESISYEIFKNKEDAHSFLTSAKSRAGWIFQQFLKVYSIFVIPDISANVLIIDADTIFLRPVEFIDPQTGAGLYNPGTENHTPYFDHLRRVLPDFIKIFPNYSGISHHMLFQRSVMQALFKEIKRVHGGKEPWKVFCDVIDKKELYKSCMCVEYEQYFNFVFAHSDKVKIRQLKWKNVRLSQFNVYKNQGYHYLSCHSWMG